MGMHYAIIYIIRRVQKSLAEFAARRLQTLCRKNPEVFSTVSIIYITMSYSHAAESKGRREQPWVRKKREST